MTIRALLALTLLTIALPGWAQGGDPAAGKAKSATCTACHGADGNSTNPEWPKIAGQHAGYIEQQLHNYKGGELRNNVLMTGMVAPLTDQDMTDLAAYFSSQTMTGGYADETLVEQGESIYRGGIDETGVPACMSCHGPRGLGDPRGGFPRLAGQHATYIRNSLEMYRLETRSSDPRRMMRDIAIKLTPDQMEAVASYINGLH